MLSFTVLVVMLSSLALLNSVCSYGLPLKMSLSTKKTVSVNTVKAISTAANGKAKSEILFVTSFDENSDKKKNVIDALAAMLNQKVSYQKPQSGVKMSHDTKVLAIGANEVSADDQLLQKVCIISLNSLVSNNLTSAY